MTRVTTVYLLICFLLTTANAIRILGIFPIFAKSHFGCNHAILKSLHAAGHQVTMITPFPNEEKVENFTYINSISHYSPTKGEHTIEKMAPMTITNDFLNIMITIFIKGHCYDVLKLPAIQEALNSPKKLYDIILMEVLLDHECYLPLAEKMRIPVIGTMTFNRNTKVDRTLGLPSSLPVLPLGEIRNLGPQMSILERIQNTYFHFFMGYAYWKIGNEIEMFYRENFAQDLLHKKELSLVFYNNHPSLLPWLNVPNAIEVGGIHIAPAKPLPKDLQTFIDEAQFGVILFSLGSMVKGSFMSTEQREAFLAAFASVPQRIIWKYEKELENLPKNIMISHWLPQRDILEHKNVLAFMSHCGLSGIYEATVTGTPVVMIPLFGDQFLNAAILRNRGVGVDLNFKTVTTETILEALNRIINDTSYYRRMQELSRVFQNRPMTPEESVVYWTEYVVEHDGAAHLKVLGTDIPFYKYFMLDIIALAFLLTSLVIYLSYRVVSKLYALLWLKREDTRPLKKDY